MDFSDFASEALARRGVRRRWEVLCGHKTHLIEAGSGPATLLWFPAVGDAVSSFGPVLITLAERLKGTARVMAADPPGYGSSPLPPGTTLPTFGELMAWAEAIPSTAPGPWVLAGNSSGGVYAAAAATSGGAAAAGLLLVGWANWGIMDHPEFDLLCPADRAGLDRLLARTWHKPPPMREALARSLLERLGDPGYKRHVSSFDKNDFAARLEHFQGPVAFIGGARDGLVPPELIEASATSRKGAKSRLLEECGHYPHRERPAQFASVLEELARWCLSDRP